MLLRRSDDTTQTSGDQQVQAALTWALVVATCDRSDMLLRCVELATKQTRPPAEIVVVDASDDWQQTRSIMLERLAVQHPTIRWDYQKSVRRSTTAQRNQGIRAVISPIIFLLDDDSMMYRDCAEQVMRVYDRDVDKQVVGVSAVMVDTPVDDAGEQSSEEVDNGHRQLRLVDRFEALGHRMLSIEHFLVPYEQKFPDHDVPETIRNLSVRPVRYIHGMRMTYRREAIEREMFEEMFEGYSASEDMDASYRVSRHGALVEISTAKLHHIKAGGGGRLAPFVHTALGVLNHAASHRLHSTNMNRSMRIYRRLLRKKLALEAARDLYKGRWRLPNARGVLFALRHLRDVANCSRYQVRQWYPTFQRKLIERRGGL